MCEQGSLRGAKFSPCPSRILVSSTTISPLFSPFLPHTFPCRMAKMDCKLVVGIYGVSGSGKSRLLSQLSESRPEWRCLEGSQVIGMVMEDRDESFKDFHVKTESEKNEIRNHAVKMIGGFSGVTIVAGHFSFPEIGDPKEDITFNDVFTEGDGETFDAIIYLDKDPSCVYRQREQDNETSKRSRLDLSVAVVQQWMEHEKKLLRAECQKRGISLKLVSDDTVIEDYIWKELLTPLVARVQDDSEKHLKEAVGTVPPANVFLLIDGDRTLCPLDTGKVFIDHVVGVGGEDPLKMIFKRYDSYTFQAFFEVAMFYANVTSIQRYKEESNKIGSKTVVLYDEWIWLLSNLPSSVHAIVLTSGNREIWCAALDSHKVANSTTLIAGNHIGLHPYVVDSHAKAIVVKELRDLYKGCRIISFGDSAVDIPMMEISDDAYIVIDDRQNRSMNDYISSSLRGSGGCLHLHQINPLKDGPFLHNGIQSGSLERLQADMESLNVFKAVDCSQTSTAAKVLATQSRRSDLHGPALQAIHFQIGQYLADRLLDEMGRCGLLVEQESLPHVQGTSFHGLVTLPHVVILPLMRGGEPMSRGVYERFPRSKLIHFDDKVGKSSKTLESAMASSTLVKDIIVVDSVVNEGRSVRRTLALLKDYNARVYVLTAVMQHEAAFSLPKEFPRVRFVTLSVSENKYAGKGGTDTGNRLFGTY